MEKLAILGGKPYVNERAPKELFKWPIITEEDELAIMDVIRNNKFSGTDITQKFENEFKDWLGREYAIAYTNGTLSLAAAMYAIGLGAGDEVICPTKTYWASIIQSAIMGATPVFCNITDNLVIDPDDIEFLGKTLLSLPKREEIEEKAPTVGSPCRVMTVREAMMSPSKEVAVRDAVGKILAAPGVSCPPAIPIVLCGEQIGEREIELFEYYGIEKCRVVE